jgi:CxxC-x17-CxxC domain-containing protein
MPSLRHGAPRVSFEYVRQVGAVPRTCRSALLATRVSDGSVPIAPLSRQSGCGARVARRPTEPIWHTERQPARGSLVAHSTLCTLDGAHVFCRSTAPAGGRAVRSTGAVSDMSADTTLTCRDCGKAFTFTSGEQDFYASRGFSEPTRCPDCRAARKAQRDSGSHSGGYGSSAGSGGNRGTREMFSVTCSSCGQQAQVPFQPTGAKPVYCSSCYEQRRDSDRSSGNRYGGRGRY